MRISHIAYRIQRAADGMRILRISYARIEMARVCGVCYAHTAYRMGMGMCMGLAHTVHRMYAR